MGVIRKVFIFFKVHHLFTYNIAKWETKCTVNLLKSYHLAKEVDNLLTIKEKKSLEYLQNKIRQNTRA